MNTLKTRRSASSAALAVTVTVRLARSESTVTVTGATSVCGVARPQRVPAPLARTRFTRVAVQMHRVLPTTALTWPRCPNADSVIHPHTDTARPARAGSMNTLKTRRSASSAALAVTVTVRLARSESTVTVTGATSVCGVARPQRVPAPLARTRFTRNESKGRTWS